MRATRWGGVAALVTATALSLGACNPVGLSNGWYPSGGTQAGCQKYKDRYGHWYTACQKVSPTPSNGAHK
jgi:hypothetical protein